MRLRDVGQVHGLQVPSIVVDVFQGDVDSVSFLSALRAGSPRTLSTVLTPRRHSMVGCTTVEIREGAPVLRRGHCMIHICQQTYCTSVPWCTVPGLCLLFPYQRVSQLFTSMIDRPEP